MTDHEGRENECWDIASDTGGYQAALWAIAAGLFAVASSTKAAARHLGLNDAATPMGAIEVLSKNIGEAMDGIADAIRSRDE